MKTPDKFTVIYSFKVVDGKDKDFINSWAELTKLIYEFEGSYGSRLHKVNSKLFIGYAQWPSKEIYDQSGNKLPESANKFREQMRECCSEIKTEFELSSIVLDLLKDEQHL
jgi:hypothetical protein